jgi:hypothetical protein
VINDGVLAFRLMNIIIFEFIHSMNRARIVKKDYQKLLKGLPQDHPPHANVENRYALNDIDHSPD